MTAGGILEDVATAHVPGYDLDSENIYAGSGMIPAGAGDLDGDGYGDFLLADHKFSADEDPDSEIGAVRVFHGPAAGTLATADALLVGEDGSR